MQNSTDVVRPDREPERYIPPDGFWYPMLNTLKRYDFADFLLSSFAGFYSTRTDAYLCWAPKEFCDVLVWALGAVLKTKQKKFKRVWQLRSALPEGAFLWFLETHCPADGWTHQDLAELEADIDLMTKVLPREIEFTRELLDILSSGQQTDNPRKGAGPLPHECKS